MPLKQGLHVSAGTIDGRQPLVLGVESEEAVVMEETEQGGSREAQHLFGGRRPDR